MTEQKDHTTLIEAFGRLADDYPDWDLKLSGDGHLRSRLEEQVRRLGLSERVWLAGFSQDIGNEYECADLFVIPSRFESFGLVTAEALAHGLPVIGFADCAGTNELVTTGVNGLLVSGVDRVVELEAGLRRLMADPCERQRLAAKGPLSVLDYSVENASDRWETVLRDVAGRR
jgi:glycosyltransferase involved in cell wall biosynthesis